MKVETISGPSVMPLPQTTATQSQNAARERAVAMIKAGTEAPQDLPVSNPNQVSPEELSAIKPSEKVQTNEAETKAVEETPAKDKELLSTQYAQLARREKAMYAKAQAREKALAEREASIKATEDSLKAKDSSYQADYVPKQRLTEDTISVLLENGISYDQITQLMLNQSQQDPATKVAIQKLEAQVKAQADAREEDRKAYAAQQDAAYKQAVNQIRQDAQQLVKQESNKYEAINKTNSIKDVVELIEETFKEDGVILSVEEACQEVEDHLVEKLSKYSSNISKIQQRMNAAQKAAPQQTGQNNTQTQQQQPKPTLNNAMGTSKKLSAKERAILAFKGELK